MNSQFRKTKRFKPRTDLDPPEKLGIDCPHTERKKDKRGLCTSCYRRYMRYACALDRLAHRDRERERRKQLKGTKEYISNGYKNRIKSRYGLTIEQYDKMLVEQGGVCYICHITPVKRLQIDHSHSTRKVRGLLCGRCNKGLAHYKDNPENFKRAIEYLERDYDGRLL